MGAIQQSGQQPTNADTAMTGCVVFLMPETAHAELPSMVSRRIRIAAMPLLIALALMTASLYILADAACSSTNMSYLLARAWQFDNARLGSPVRDGCDALCSVRQEQLPDPEVVARCPVLSLGIPVVEFAH